VLVEKEPSVGEPAAVTSKRPSARRRLPRVPGWPPAKGSRQLINLVTVIVTVVFSYIALSDIDLSLAWRALRTSDLWWIVASLIPFGLGSVARALRWRSLFARGRRPPVGAVTNAMMVGYFYNNILPARAGEAARVVVLTQRSTTAPVEIIGTVVLERLYDVVAILVIFFAAEPWLPHVSWFGAAAARAAHGSALRRGLYHARSAGLGDHPDVESLGDVDRAGDPLGTGTNASEHRGDRRGRRLAAGDRGSHRGTQRAPGRLSQSHDPRALFR
jgi:hypothetical protein